MYNVINYVTNYYFNNVIYNLALLGNDNLLDFLFIFSLLIPKFKTHMHLSAEDALRFEDFQEMHVKMCFIL